MKIEINKDEYFHLLVGMNIYKERLKSNLKNNENYFMPDRKEINNSIINIDVIINKLIETRSEEINNEKI